MGEALRIPGSPGVPPAPEELTRAILARTSGSPCLCLRERACDFVDGALGPDQESLVRTHLEHCPACAALVAALAMATRVLPELAAADPGPWFAQRVLRATAWRCRPAGFGGDAWRRLLRRPRFALEVAYLGAAAGLLGFSVPIPALRSQTLVQACSPKPLVRPLEAPALRVAGEMAQAARRTGSSLRRVFPRGNPFLVPARSLQARLNRSLRAFHRAPRPGEKPASGANP